MAAPTSESLTIGAFGSKFVGRFASPVPVDAVIPDCSAVDPVAKASAGDEVAGEDDVAAPVAPVGGDENS